MSSTTAPRTSRRQFLRQLAAGTVALAGASRLASAAAEMAAPAAGRKLGVALLGLGGYSGGQLAPALRQTRFCRLAGVVTGHPEKAERWARDYDLPQENLYSYETFDRIADNPAIDIVYVVTPPALHAQFAIAAARAGKHVICEKPMATSVADCDAIIAACRDAGVKLSIGYRLHFHPLHQEVKRLAREKDFGAFTRMDGGFGFRVGSKTWRLTKTLGGGGPLMDVGIYPIQSACMAAGAAPVAVTAHEEPKTRPELFDEVEETIRFTLEFPDGARAEGVASFNEGFNRFRAEAPDGWIELEPAFSYSGLAGRTSRGPLPGGPFVQQAAQMDDFADCILRGRETIVPGEMGRRDIQITSAIYEAARTGRRMTI